VHLVTKCVYNKQIIIIVKLGLNVVIISLLQVVTGLGELEILKPDTKEKHRFIKKSDFHELHIIPTSSDIQTFMSSSFILQMVHASHAFMASPHCFG
jgi:hypothetical protein